MGFRYVGLLLTLSLVALACGNGDPALPEATGSAVWNYLQEIEYRQNWELWPGKGEFFEGGEPHGALFTTYINPLTLGALEIKAGTIPLGGIIVKENYAPDRTFILMTVMFKVDGFNPENNNWFWANIGAAGDVQAEGRLAGCQACHGAARANDFVLSGPLR